MLQMVRMRPVLLAALLAVLVPGGWSIDAVQVTGPRDLPARRTGSAVIRGTVVDGATGAPLRRASVSLLGAWVMEPE